MREEERPLAEKLALKKYQKRLLREKEEELLLRKKKDIRHLLKPAFALLMSPAYHELLIPSLGDHMRELAEWMKQDYEKNPYHKESLLLKTPVGEYVRSKSEYIIYMALLENHIPFRYDCRIDLSGHVFYADFIIRHPQTGEYFIWEHFGLMDMPDYIKKSMFKLEVYSSNGWTLMQNLIVTSETSEKPLNPDWVYTLIHHFFLS